MFIKEVDTTAAMTPGCFLPCSGGCFGFVSWFSCVLFWKRLGVGGGGDTSLMLEKVEEFGKQVESLQTECLRSKKSQQEENNTLQA